MPPPASTGHEADYFETAQQDGATIVVVMGDGTQVTGVVTGSDRNLVVLDAEGGEVVIRKAEIKYVHDPGDDPGAS